MADAAVDNDVLIKLASYKLMADGLDVLGGPAAVGILGAARFVVPSAITRHRGIADKDAAMAQWSAVETTVEALEPTASEAAFAAEIEELATRTGRNLDPGESQLCAMAIERAFNHLATGDKRAVMAAESMLADVAKLKELAGKIVCMEQLAVALLARIGSDAIRDAVCSEPGVDRALTACLGCASRAEESSVDTTGFESYIADLRRRAPTLLAGEPPGADARLP